MAYRFTRILWIAAGTLSLAAGLIGLLLPLIPTTPFLLLASACYLRGSARLHRWLLNQGRLGAYIRSYEAGAGIPLRAKIITLAMLWGSMSVSIYHFERPLLRLALMLIAGGVTVWILRLPTAPANPP